MDTFMDKLAQRFTAQEMIKANSAAEADEMNKLKAQVAEYTQCLNRMQQICAELEQTAEFAKGKVDAAQLHTDELREQLLEIRRQMQSQEEGTDVRGTDDLAMKLEQMLDSRESRLEDMKDEQQRMLEGFRGLVEDRIAGILSAQDARFDSLKTMYEEQLAGIRTLQDNQLNGMKGMQDAQVEIMRSSVEDQLDSIRSMIKAQISNLRSGQDGQLDSLQKLMESQSAAMDTQLSEMKTNMETQLGGVNDFVHKECVKVYRNVQAVVGEENNKQSENLDYTFKPMAKKIKSLFSISVAALVVSGIGVVMQVLSMLKII